jgi:hypothetical protein
VNTALRIAREEEAGVGVAKIEEVSVLSWWFIINSKCQVIAILKATNSVEESLRIAFDAVEQSTNLPFDQWQQQPQTLQLSQQTQQQPLQTHNAVHILHRALQVHFGLTAEFHSFTREQDKEQLNNYVDDQDRCYSCGSSEHFSQECPVPSDVRCTCSNVD